jgi:hypothetical protein
VPFLNGLAAAAASLILNVPFKAPAGCVLQDDLFPPYAPDWQIHRSDQSSTTIVRLAVKHL